MKTNELEGARLDYFVAKALGYEHFGAVGTNEPNDAGKPWCRSGHNDWWKGLSGEWICGPCEGFPYKYSEEWERGGPIIELESITIMFNDYSEKWHAYSKPLGPVVYDYEDHASEGDTPLIAAMRAFVASKFGDEVPDVENKS